MEIFKVENVSFSFKETPKKILKDVSFSINEGDFVVLFGESGSGKTTLLKTLKRELTLFGEIEGDIFYKGTKLNEVDERVCASEIGFVMQKPDDQIVLDKVWHELAFGLENIGLPTTVMRRRIGEMANFFGIHHWFQKKTSELSGGQKQLLNVASAMVMQPRVLLLDEPTSQLDPIAASEFIDLLHKLNRDLGLTIIIVEHRLEEIFPIANKVILLERGEIVLTDHPCYIGQKLKKIDENHSMLSALPSSVRIFNGLDGNGKSPLTVREGMNYLSTTYENHIPFIGREVSSEGSEEKVLELKNVWFRYERDTPDVLAGIHFDVRKGEIISILGGNGSGKTTLLNVLSGQAKPYRGEYFIDGKKAKKYKGKELYKHHLALLPQDPQTLFIKSTVREDYQEISKVMGYSKEEMTNNIERVTSILSIEDLLDAHPFNLSGGEQQKVALGKVLLLHPKILLLDEPTKGIDVFSKRKLLSVLHDLQKQGITIIIVTHDVEFAALVSDRCGLFFNGDVTSLDSPVEFFSNNNFYTTMANRISRHRYRNAITCEDVIHICQLNGLKERIQNGN